MPETSYTPEPRPSPFTTQLSRNFGTDFGSPITIRGTDAAITVNNTVNDIFKVYTLGVGIAEVKGFTWMTVADTGTASAPVSTELYHIVTSGTPTTNVGVSLDFRSDSTSASRSFAARISSLFTTATTPVTSEMRHSINVAGVTTEILRVHSAGLSLFQTQVVGSRKTGWTAATGTPSRATFDTATVTTAQLAGRVMALLDDLISHGLIGA